VCENNYLNLNFGQCVPSQDDASSALYPADAFCMGSANTRLAAGGMAAFHFSMSGNCDVTSDAGNVATIRGYGCVAFLLLELGWLSRGMMEA
jgi:hypothetical protein